MKQDTTIYDSQTEGAVAMDDSSLMEMRAQIALLKNRLDHETIVNDRLLREAMRGKIGVLRTNAIIEYVSVLVCFLLIPVSFPAIGFSWWLVGVSLAMVLLSGILTAVWHRHMNTLDEGDDLLTVARHARRLKQAYVDWIKWAIILILFWFGWIVTECLIRIPDHTQGLIFAIGCGIGLIIGASIGLAIHRKVIRTCEDIIRQIEG